MAGDVWGVREICEGRLDVSVRSIVSWILEDLIVAYEELAELCLGLGGDGRNRGVLCEAPNATRTISLLEGGDLETLFHQGFHHS